MGTESHSVFLEKDKSHQGTQVRIWKERILDVKREKTRLCFFTFKYLLRILTSHTISVEKYFDEVYSKRFKSLIGCTVPLGGAWLFLPGTLTCIGLALWLG